MRHLGIFGRICRLYPDQWRGFRIPFQLPGNHLEELDSCLGGLERLVQRAVPRSWGNRASHGRRVLKRLISFTRTALVGPSPRAETFCSPANPSTH